MATCELYKTNKESWSNFDIIEDYHELSDFASWAIKTAAEKCMKNKKREVTGWYWSNSNLVYDMRHREHYFWGITKNMILVLRVFDANYNQVSQYRVKMVD